MKSFGALTLWLTAVSQAEGFTFRSTTTQQRTSTQLSVSSWGWDEDDSLFHETSNVHPTRTDNDHYQQKRANVNPAAVDHYYPRTPGTDQPQQHYEYYRETTEYYQQQQQNTEYYQQQQAPSMAVMMSRETKRVLIEELGYSRKEVKRLKFDCAHEIVQKRFRRPKGTLPAHWFGELYP